ncbi:bifunctional DNA primase/polymerase [Spongisporangium articulatum]|uniref:Bifunctional DNA primase/polymerase n=1 Tax=Spongisporangium articulatum TaxID=3362603 RepID=A0ABW8APY8_9ACTN
MPSSAVGRGVPALRYRRALARAAVRAAAAGLPVVPGAWWSTAERRFECDVAGCTRTGPHPVVPAAYGGLGAIAGEGLAAHAIRHPAAVTARWRRAPYAVLVPTGETCDVVDVPASTGRTLALRLDARSELGPVIAAGARWFFLTAPGGRLPAWGGDTLVHGLGSWIMLPPSLGPGGEPAGWLVRPGRTGWYLPTRDAVLRELDGPAVPSQRRYDEALRPA